MAVSILMTAACGGVDPDPGPQVPGTEPGTEQKAEISKPEVSDIQSKSVSVKASTTIAASSITKKGFVYSETEDPSISSTRTECSGADFSAVITGLSSGRKYYLKAFVMADGKTYYSEQVDFTTEASRDLESYTPPSYADDYRPISGWADRDKWNLANVHDPTVVLADDGYYYMYQTDASFGNAHDAGGHFHGRRSKNLIDWEYLGGTMKTAPAWVLEKLNEYRKEMKLPEVTDPRYGYWAPCVRKVKVGGKTIYRMYYSIVLDNYIGNGKPTSTAFDGTWSERAFIGLMETSDPSDNESWVDKGFVICSSSDKGLDYKRSSTGDWNGYFRFNAIDPSYIVTAEGEHWLIYGSWHSGIAAVQLDPQTGKTLETLPKPWGTGKEIAPYGKLIESRGGRWQGSEGPEVVYHDGYYYLFIAYDELSVAYNTRVVRSKNIDGPYVDINGSDATNLTQAYPVLTHPYKFTRGNGWVGISHCAVFDDGQGNWFYASQARFPTNAGGNAPNAVMLGHVRRILWSQDGWPLVLPERYGAVPQVEISKEDIAGTWENIDIIYRYQEQRTASTMEFTEDGKISSGAWKGATWTLDSKNNLLKISNGVTLSIARECDWEAAPRKATIVYAGHGNNKTYWGKKVN